MATVSSNELALRESLEERRTRLRSALGGAADPDGFRRLLDQVDQALQRLDRGSYGICEVCHEPIERDRFTADPLVRNCLGCLTPDQQRNLEHDLDRAGQIQSALLPPRDLATPGWDVDYRYEPAGPVSGDYCDLIPAPRHGDGFYFFVGDVSGKGISASILMSHLQAIFRGLVAAGGSLAEIVATANRMFCDSTLPSHYATVVCGWAGRSGEVEIVNAGHCPALLVLSGGTKTLPSTGLPIGMFSSGDYVAKTVRFDRDDAVVLYTDGLPETRNGATEEFGLRRIVAQLVGRAGATAAELSLACIDGAKAFDNGSLRDDDLTVMVLRRTPYCGNASGAVSS